MDNHISKLSSIIELLTTAAPQGTVYAGIPPSLGCRVRIHQSNHPAEDCQLDHSPRNYRASFVLHP